MTKQETIARLAETMEIKKSEVETFYNAFEAQVLDAMVDGEEIPFLGKFKVVAVKARAERMATNPQDPTGAKIKIEAKEATKKVKYAPSKKVKELFA